MRMSRRSSHKIYLYDAGGGAAADLPAIASYLSRLPGIEVTEAGDVISAAGAQAEGRTPPGEVAPPAQVPRSIDELARALASTRVHDFSRRDSYDDPLPAEVRFLRRRLTRESLPAFGHPYDGTAVMSVFRLFLRPGPELPLIFTDQILVTWDEGDLRYHARALVAGSPALISAPGVVIAPARPREYYIYQQAARASGASDDQIEMKMHEAMGDRYVFHGDGRIPEILKGYSLQAAAYWFFGESFCEDPDCRLFNAHWQEEMIRAQLGGEYELCPRHAALLGLER